MGLPQAISYADLVCGMTAAPKDRLTTGFSNLFHWHIDPPDQTPVSWLKGIATVGRFLTPARGAGLTFWKLAGRQYR